MESRAYACQSVCLPACRFQPRRGNQRFWHCAACRTNCRIKWIIWKGKQMTERARSFLAQRFFFDTLKWGQMRSHWDVHGLELLMKARCFGGLFPSSSSSSSFAWSRERNMNNSNGKDNLIRKARLSSQRFSSPTSFVIRPRQPVLMPFTFTAHESSLQERERELLFQVFNSDLFPTGSSLALNFREFIHLFFFSIKNKIKDHSLSSLSRHHLRKMGNTVV